MKNDKNNTLILESNGKKLEFRRPSKVVYYSLIDLIYSENEAELIEMMFDNLIIGENKYGFDEKILVIQDLITEFIEIPVIDIKLDDAENFIFTINDKEVIFKRPTREQFKAIYTKNKDNGIISLEYCYNELYVSGYKFDLTKFEDLRTFAGCHKIPNLIIYNKTLDLKKK